MSRAVRLTRCFEELGATGLIHTGVCPRRPSPASAHPAAFDPPPLTLSTSPFPPPSAPNSRPGAPCCGCRSSTEPQEQGRWPGWTATGRRRTHSMYIYLSIYIYIYKYIFMFIYIYIYIYIVIHIYINAHNHLCMVMYIHIYIYIYIMCSSMHGGVDSRVGGVR